MFHNLKAQGLSISEIARQQNCDRKTVRKYLNSDFDDLAVTKRKSATGKLDSFKSYLVERVNQYPSLSARRLHREIGAFGYQGGYSILCAFLQTVRPQATKRFEKRFETPPGEQAQADFAVFKTVFGEDPQRIRILALFTIILGYSRYLWGRFCESQKMSNVVRMHELGFEHFGGATDHVLVDRMKTAVLNETEDGVVQYNPTYQSLLLHYGATPRACKAYRGQTKGKVERPYRYVREDFFLGSCFENLEHLNSQFDAWLEMSNKRRHGTTGQIVAEDFEKERPALKALPPMRFPATLVEQRKISKDGMVSFQGNFYSVPDGIRSRSVGIQAQAFTLRIVDKDQVIAQHCVAEGKGNRVMDPSHRTVSAEKLHSCETQSVTHTVAQRPLEVYDRIATRMSKCGQVSS